MVQEEGRRPALPDPAAGAKWKILGRVASELRGRDQTADLHAADRAEELFCVLDAHLRSRPARVIRVKGEMGERVR